MKKECSNCGSAEYLFRSKRNLITVDAAGAQKDTAKNADKEGNSRVPLVKDNR